MTTPLIVANWKMNTTVPQGLELAATIQRQLVDVDDVDVDVVLLPPFTHLWPIHDILGDGSIGLGAQDVFWEDAGAYTGEISPAALAGWCDTVLVGHSERRHLLGETDDDVGRKFAKALSHGLGVIVAVGETESEREAEKTFEVVDRQLAAAFSFLEQSPPAGSFVIAYEPVWAIGTGKVATPDQAQEVCLHIRTLLSEQKGLDTSGLRILYGGSVTAANASELFACLDIGGALVGGASLKPREFVAIVMAAAERVIAEA